MTTDSASHREPTASDRTAGSILEALMRVIESRGSERPADSYVVQLLDGGAETIGRKVQEEAAEVAQAALELRGDTGPLVREVADLLFHTLVLLGWAGLSLADVEAELQRRFGTGGLQERAQRGRPA